MRNSELTTYGVVELSEIEMMEIDGGIPEGMKRGLHKIVDGLKDIIDVIIDTL